MMIDPVALMEAATTSLLVPTSTQQAKPTQLPPIVPTPPTIEQIHKSGSTTLWVVFILMVLSTIAFVAMAWRVPVQKRLFHILTAFITTFAAISYFAMATGAGTSYVHHIIKETHNVTGVDTYEHIYRQVFWARYVDWSVTTPLLLLDLSFLAGLNGASILVALVADVTMVLLGLFAAFAVETPNGTGAGTKWGWYGMSCLAFLVIVYQLAVSGREAVKSKDSKTTKLFASIGGFTLILWSLYPIVWCIGEGARKLSVDAEIISYAVLDVLAKPVFGFWLLSAHSKSIAAIEGFWAHGLSGEGSIRITDDEA